MTVAKAVARGMLIACLIAPSARGGSMLVLGMTSGDGLPYGAGPSPSPDSSSSYTPPAPGEGLRLGVYSAPNASAFVPTPVAAPSPSPTPPSPAPVSPSPASFAPAAPAASPSTYDAFVNLGTGPYPGSGGLTTGSPQPWYLGSGVDRLFGGVPDAQQQAAFDGTVMQRLQQTFNLGGVPVGLTDNPNAPAAHTLSVVSQAANPSMNNALGMTYLGGNGFQYIDTAANSANSVDQLEWIVAHNLAHELMLAFGVPEVHDQSGQFIDSRSVGLSMITNPNATFSPGAVADLLSKDFQATNGSVLFPAAQVIDSSTVPEPSTVLLWVAIGSAGLAARRARRASIRPIAG